jgi:hypothetical protein
MECLMSNSGFNNPDVVKYIVLFTDGKWNNARSLLAAPTYTNWVVCTNPTPSGTVQIVSNTAPDLSHNLTNATGVVFQPSMSPMPYYTNAVNDLTFDTSNIAHHYGDYWVSLDTNSNLEPLPGSLTTSNGGSGRAGAPGAFFTSTYLGLYGTTNVYTTSVNVWLQPGSVDYLYHNGTVSNIYVGDYNSPTNNVTLNMMNNDSNELVVPGYVVDGCFYDGLDLTYYSPAAYPYYRWDNFNTAFAWPDDQTPAPTAGVGNNKPFFYTPPVLRDSFMRTLLFRNYANMLTGFYVYRADDPTGTGTEPLTGEPRPLNGLGPYYPSAAFYWPFDLVGIDWDATFCLTNALVDPDTTHVGISRNISWSINMLSTNADPEQTGELFYNATTAGAAGGSGESAVMSSASQWQTGAPGWLTAAFGVDMKTDPTLDTNITPNPQDWRPNTFRGTVIGNTNSGTVLSIVQANGSDTGGYVIDGTTGNVYKNSMSWNGRPTHYYDFSKASWESIYTNHQSNSTSLPLGYWKAEEYAYHARASGVTIYTVGYGTLVSDAQQVILAQIANATNTTGFDETNGGVSIPLTYNASQPIGAEFYADSTNAISNDFYEIGTAINASLTQ